MLTGPSPRLAIAASVYVTLSRRPGYHLPVGPILWLDSAWFLGIGAVPLVILLFPDGKPPSRRWPKRRSPTTSSSQHSWVGLPAIR